MSAEGTIHICETCRRPVEPDALGTVHAFKQVDVTSPADTTKQYIDGIGVFFHAAHYPTGSRRSQTRVARFADCSAEPALAGRQ